MRVRRLQILQCCASGVSAIACISVHDSFCKTLDPPCCRTGLSNLVTQNDHDTMLVLSAVFAAQVQMVEAIQEWVAFTLSKLQSFGEL